MRLIVSPLWLAALLAEPAPSGLSQAPGGAIRLFGPGRTRLTVEQLAVVCRNKYVGFTTVGEIRKMGYEVVRTSGEGWHATVVVPEEWAWEAAERVDAE